jgi:hypothetical protein
VPYVLVALAAVAAVVLAGVLYVWLVWLALSALLWPALPVLVLGGVGLGLLLAVLVGGATLAGVRPAPVVRPAVVRDPRWFRPPRSGLPRDDAWPHHLVGQVRADVRAVNGRVRGLIGRPWRWFGGVLRADTVLLAAWPLLLFPVIGGLAATVGAAVGLLGLLAVLGVAWTVVTAAWSGVAVLLRAADGALRRVRRARASCSRSGCNHVTDLPTFRCDCGRLHRDLRPGALGVLFRRCACGRRLPTTVVRATALLPAVCPLCGGPLPSGSGGLTDIRVPVIGPVSAGKSRFVAAAMLALERYVRSVDGAFSAADDDSARALSAGADLVMAQAQTVKTSPLHPPAAITARLGVPSADTLLHLFDPAGELVRDREQARALPFLDEAQGIVLIVDPFSVPAVHGELSGSFPERLAEAAAATDDPEAAYQVTAQWLRDAGVPLRHRALAVVVVKADILLDLPPGAALHLGAGAVRRWLDDHDLGRLVMAAERDFGEVRYFLVSSMTGWRPDDPHTALAPLRWLAGRAGLWLPEPAVVSS